MSKEFNITLSPVRQKGRISPILAVSLTGFLAAGIVGFSVWGSQDKVKTGIEIVPQLTDSPNFSLTAESESSASIVEDLPKVRQHRDNQDLYVSPESEQRRIQGASLNINLSYQPLIRRSFPKFIPR